MNKNAAYLSHYSSPIGQLTLASDGDAILGLWIKDQKHFKSNISEKTTKKDDLAIFNKSREWLDAYFAGKNPAISALPLAPKGSVFQKSVWQILCEIPYGQTTTYGEIAKTIAKKLGKEKMSAQAVGGAVGRNPISIIIPCHRVVGTNGSLTGYAAGLDTKIHLLAHEK